MSTFSNEIRLETLKMLKTRGFGHLGGSMSIVDTLAVLYRDIMKIDPSNPSWSERDYLVLSKGHAGPALYATLALKGYFDLSLLQTLNNNGTSLPSHCDRLLTPGIDMTTGSLGQGISSAVGIAKALKIENKPNRVFTIIGDGELDEGQCYEALMFSYHHKLDNLIVFVDENKLQLDGYTVDILDQKNITEKIASFGFHTVKVDGHNEEKIKEAIINAMNTKHVPSCIVLDTVKAKGVKAFEGDIGNHHIRFSKQQEIIIDEVIKQLEEALK
ncbi:MAG: transketolase [Bacilli bacterium]|nr:transketolase [Bacilli bacterium]